MKRRLARLGRCGALCAIGVTLATHAYAASPYDDYYKYAGKPDETARAAPVDNDSYYTAPGGYTDNDAYYTPPNPYGTTQQPAKHSCNTINDSPSCISD